jgi:membrane associated rhomboid family serine protease/Zn-finger nucleic acid-binding protein
MLSCPTCRKHLVRSKAERDVVWSCVVCNGRAISTSVLRKHVIRELVEDLLWSAPSDELGHSCPSCAQPMAIVSVPLAEKTLALDVCRACKLVWFDPEEYGQMPTVAARKAAREQEKSYRASLREIIAQAHKAKPEGATYTLDSSWKWIPVFLGMPVETETASLLDRPLLTWGLCAAICAVSFAGVFGLFDPETAVVMFALVPAEFWRYGGITLLTAFFLHADFLHLLGNTYFLMIFGDNVEDYLGRRRYLKLLILAMLAGDVLHMLATVPLSSVPLIGASGGISGVVAFYALRFPKARLGISLRIYVIPVRARTAFVLWILLQIIGSWEQIVGLSNISSLAHLGGAFVGVYFWYREKDI